MISVYVAAPYAEAQNARKLRDALARRGIGCTSRWLVLETSSEKEEDQRLFARLDRYDVRRAQAVVMWNPVDYRTSGTGGRHVETGIAFALSDMPVILVGVKSNIFLHLPEGVLVAGPETDDEGAWDRVALRVDAAMDEKSVIDYGPTFDSPIEQIDKGETICDGCGSPLCPTCEDPVCTCFDSSSRCHCDNAPSDMPYCTCGVLIGERNEAHDWLKCKKAAP